MPIPASCLAPTTRCAATDVIAEPLALVLLHNGRPDEARQIRGPIRPIRRDFFRSLLLTLRGMLLVGLAEPQEATIVYSELLPYRGQVSGAARSPPDRWTRCSATYPRCWAGRQKHGTTIESP